MPGYNFEFTATEFSNGGTAIYIKKGLNYKLRKDFEIYKSKQLESTFIEVNLENEKVVTGCIHRHPSMELLEFNNDYLTNLLDTLSSENKTVVYLEILMQIYLTMTKIATFHTFLTECTFPFSFRASSAQLTLHHHQQLSQIIYSPNNYNSSFVSGNLVNTLSDHHAQLLIMGSQHSPLELDSTEQMFRDFQEIEKKKNTISSLLENVNWVSELRLNRNDVNLSSGLFLRKVEKLINFWAPFQKLSNKQKKVLNKPGLPSGILKSIEI